jgi:hypothetical protein
MCCGLYARTNTNEFVRRPVSTIERIGNIRTHACRNVCDMGFCARTNASEFERRPVSTIKCTGYGQSHSAK